MQSVEINRNSLGGVGYYLAIGPWAHFPTLVEVRKGEKGLEVHGRNWNLSMEVFPGLHKGWKYSSQMSVDFNRPPPQVKKVLPPAEKPAKVVVEKKKPYILFKELQKAGKI